MASKNQDVHLRIYMDANEATRSMEAITRRMGEVTDTIKRMRQQLKDNGLSKTASEADLAAKGLDRGFLTELKKLEDEQYVYKRIIKSTSTSIKDFSKLVTESAHMTRAELETTLKQIEKRFNTFHPANDKDKANMLELQHLYETVRVELERRNVKQMTGADALKVYNQAQQLMKQGALADAQALREVGVALGRAKDAQGISIAESRKYAQAQVEVNEVLKARGAVFVDTAKSAATLQNAQRLLDLSRQGKSDVSLEETAKQNATQRRVEAEKQLVQMQQAYTDGLKDLDERHEKAAQKREAHLQKEKVLQDAVNAARAGLSTTEVKNYDEYKQQAKDLELYTQRQREAGAAATHHSQLVKAQRAELANLEADIKTREEQLKNAEAAPDRDEKHVAKLTQELGDLRVQRESMKSTQATLLTEEQRLNAEYAKSQAETLAVKNNMSALEATWKNNADAVKKLQEAEKALNDFQAKGLKTGMADSTYEKKKKALEQQLQLAKDNVEAQKQAEAEAIRIYEQAVKNGGIDIATLREMYKELEFVRDHTKDEKTVNAMTNTLRDMKTRIDELSRARVNESEVAKRASDLIAKGGKAEVSAIKQTIEDLRILSEQQGVSAANAKLYSQQIARLESLYKSAGSAARDLAHDQSFINATLKNVKTAPVQDLEKVMLMLKNRMHDAQTSLVQYIQASVELKQVQAQMRAVNNEMQKQGDWFTTNAKKLMNYLGVFGGFYLVRQEFTRFFDASIKYDDQLTNIQKTTNLTDNAIRLMADGIKHIETRTSVEELNNLAYQAGKLGVNGVSDLLGFVRASDMLRVSLGEQLGDDAAEKLMKIANIMGDTDTYGLEEALTRTGSAITYMAKNSPASGDAIVAFMSRTAGLSRQAGITSAELTGLAAAVSALNQPVEMSATSFSKMMVQMEKSYKTVGAALKMTDQEMETMRLNLESGRGMEAFLDMLKRVREMGGLSMTASIAKDLGSEGSRVIQTLTTLSSSYETIARMVRQSTEAFEENITVQDEYKKKNENTAALYEKLKNSFAKLFVSQDSNEWLRELLEKLQVLPGAVEQLISNFRWLGNVVGGFVVNHITGLVNALSTLLYLLAGRSAINSLGGAIINTIASFKTFAANMRSTTIPAVQRLNVELQGNVVWWKSCYLHAQKFFILCKAASIGNALFTIISVLTVIYNLFLNNEKEIKNWSDSTASAIGRVKQAAQETTDEMEELLKAHEASNLAEAEDLRIRERLQEMFGDYLSNLKLEEMEWRQVEDAVRAANEQLQANQILDATRAHIKDIRKQDTEEQAPEYGKMMEQVKKRLTATDEQQLENQAVAIVNEMMAHPELYTGAKNKKGQYTKNKYYTGDLDTEEQAIQDNLNALFERVAGSEGFKAINQKMQQYVNNSDNMRERERQGRDVDFVDEIQDIFVPFANSLQNTEESVQDAIRLGNAQAAQHIEKAMPWLKTMMQEQWNVFGGSVSRNGQFDATTVRKERTTAQSQDATTDDWARDKRDVLDPQRVLEVSAANGWLKNAQNYLKDLRSLNGERPDTAEITALQNQISNVTAWLKIWDIGNIKVDPDPNNKPKGSAMRDARQEMDNLIQKIKTFYEIQANAYKEMRQKQQITETEYKRYLEQNQRDLSRSLSDAYAALAQDADMTEDRYKQITERMRQENQRSGAGSIGETQIGIVSDTSYASVQNISKVLSGDKENGTAWTNSMRRKRREEEGNITESLNKEMQARLKAWLEQNPLGKIAEDFQKQFEEMNLIVGIKPEFNADGVEIRNLTQVEDDLMSQLYEIGKNISQFDITDAGQLTAFQSYVTNMKLFPDVAKTAALKTEEDVKAFYYKAYEYAEQYQEQVNRLVQQSENMWSKMFKQAQSAIDDRVKTFNIDELQKANDYLQKWGWSGSVNFQQEVEYRKKNLALAQEEWEFLKKKAAEELAAAQALEDNAPGKQKQVDVAEAKVKDLELEPQFVLDAMGKLNDSMLKLRENTWGWTADLEKNFEKFGENIFALQSWYDINMKHNSAWTNAFGTKAQRQKAFADFMDDLKKTLRDMVVERVRAAITAKLQERMIEKAQIPGVSKKDRKDQTLNDAQKVADSPVVRQAAEHEAMLSELDVYHRAVEEKEEEHQQIMARIKGEQRQAIVLNPADAEKSPEDKENDDHASFVDQAVKQEEGQNIILSGLKKGWRKLFNWKKKSKKDEVSLEKTTNEQITDVVEQGGEDRSAITQTVEKGISKVMAQQGAENIAQNDATNQTIVQSDAAKAQADTALGIASGSAKTVGELGWWGIPLIAVISAALSALLSAALNMVGGGPKSSTKGAKTKLVSGMLTYDSGNAQSFPVMGDDGRVYRVSQTQGRLQTGMVTRPTLTTVGGVPALVGERGPEMVIGRETTSAMMMSRPDLIRQIVEFDRNRSRGFAKTFDSGNVGDAAAELGVRSEESGADGSSRGMSEETAVALTAAIAMLSDQLSRPITAKFDMNGKGGAADQMAQGLLNSRRLGDLDSVKRLFGSR